MKGDGNNCIKLIVNADDFGLTHLVNAEIIRCIDQGLVTSVSLMPGGYAAEEALAAARTFKKEIGVGVHLTLDGVYPVNEVSEVASLVTKADKFYPRGKMLFRLMTGRVDLSQVRREWSAQIQKVIDSGIVVDHLDGHGHIHVFPLLTDIVLELAKYFGIAAVRLPSDRFISGIKHDRLADRLFLRMATRFARNKFEGQLKSPDYMIGFPFGGNYQEKFFLQDLSVLKKGQIVEAMFHPGPEEIDMAEFNSWQYCWDVDSATLRSPRVREFIFDNDIELINFHNLCER